MSTEPGGESAPTPAIRASGLWKQYGRVTALRGLSLELAQGSLMALFGPNGAGKTTLIKVLSGLAKPTRGGFSILGLEGGGSNEEIRRRVAVLSHGSFLYPQLTALENLVFYARMYGLPQPAVRAGELLERFGLAGRRHQRVGGFSRGMQQRLALARALLHEPDVLLLDEPFSGLDQQAAAVLRDLLGSLRNSRRTVLLTTHNVAEGLDLCDEVAIQVEGKIAYRGRPVDAASFTELYLQVVGSAFRWESRESS